MAYLIHIGLALLAQVIWETAQLDATPRLWLAIAACAIPPALGSFAHRAYLAGRFRAADRAFLALSWSPVLLHAACVFNGGWVERVESWAGRSVSLTSWPDGWMLLALAPFVVYSLLAIDARARLGLRSREHVRKTRRFQVRLFAASLVPVAAYVAISTLVGAVGSLRLQIETVAAWNALYAALMLALFATSVPWLLRNSWETESMPESVERSLLESVAQRAGFDGRRLFVWRTGNSVANAAIVGVFPRHRVVLFSDLLLSQLDLRELASVFAHEIGHAKRGHVFIFTAWAFAALFGADLLGTAIAPEHVVWNAVVLVAAMLLWAISFGWMSRRFELEADMYSLRLIGDAAPLVGALEKVSGPHGRARTSWRHFSTQKRIEFLEATVRDPAVGRRLERRLAWVARAGVALFLVVMAIEGVGLARQWPVDQLVLDLRRGDYESAIERARANPDLDSGLSALVARAASLKQGDLEEIKTQARAAVAARDLDAAGEWLELGALRDDADMARVRELIASLSEGAADAELVLSATPDAWREAIEALLKARSKPESRPARSLPYN